MHTGDPLPMKKIQNGGRSGGRQAKDERENKKSIRRSGGEGIQELDHERGKNR